MFRQCRNAARNQPDAKNLTFSVLLRACSEHRIDRQLTWAQATELLCVMSRQQTTLGRDGEQLSRPSAVSLETNNTTQAEDETIKNNSFSSLDD